MQAIDKTHIANYWELLKLYDRCTEVPYAICYTFHVYNFPK